MHAGRALSEFVILRGVRISECGSRRGGKRRWVGRIILYERLARVIEQGGRRGELGARNWALLDVAAVRVLVHVHVVSFAVGHWSDLFAFVCASATEEPDEKCNDDDDASNDGTDVGAATASVASV